MRFLICDDNPDDRFIMGRALRLEADAVGTSAEIVEVEGIAQTVAALDRGPYDAAVIDMIQTSGVVGTDIGCFVAAAGIPYVYVTGNRGLQSLRFNAPIIPKSSHMEALRVWARPILAAWAGAEPGA